MDSIFRYIVITCLFTAAAVFQVGSTVAALRRVPVDMPVFAPASSGATIAFVDHKATAAGLHEGDILLAINGRPYTGTAVFWEERLKAVPGSTLAVSVRSPGTKEQERVVLLPIAPGSRLLQAKTLVIVFDVVLPVLCIALGFWTVLVRPSDLSAWLLLGLFLSFPQLLSGAPPIESWGPGMLKLAYGYSTALVLALPIFMFLFGFYFPEPLPFFRRSGSWRNRIPWIATIPYAIYGVGLAAVTLGGLTQYSWGEPLYRALKPLRHVFSLYGLSLIGAFFGFVVTKSVIAISPDAKRRLRLLYCGATVGLFPLLLLAVIVGLKGITDLPDWLILIVVLMFLVFPLTLAYVIVVQRAMDVRVVIRQGLQYGLAKKGILTLQAATVIIVILTALALMEQSRARPQKIVVIAVGILAVFTIGRLAKGLGLWTDRRFFREAYDAEQVLSELSDGVRGMVDSRSLLETVVDRIAETLHIPRVAVLLGGVGPYRPAYSVGYGAPPDIAFPQGAGTVKMLQRKNEPARVYFDDRSSWLYHDVDVTEEDRSKLTQLDTELLVPLNTRDNLLGFISLGPKRSEEPYSRADLRLLTSVASQTGLALENASLISAVAVEVAQRERLNSEVAIAREVQERLFPQTLPPITGIDYAGACRSALGVGGDYYDFIALTAGKLGIAIGDVSGKGIAAALMMASLQASLRSEASRTPDDLGGMISNVNRLMYEASSSNRYATFFYGQYDPASRQLTYVNAGHNPPMLLHCSDGGWPVSRLETGGTVVGLLESFPYQQATVTISPGDILIFFTDGISEAMNEANDEFGEVRLIETIKCCAALSPAEIITGVMRAADEFVAGAEQHDDMTLVVLCARPETGG